MPEPKDTEEDSILKLEPKNLCQIELQITDIDISLRFYEELFGWRAVPIELDNYTVLDFSNDQPFGISLVHRQSDKAIKPPPILYFEGKITDLQNFKEKVSNLKGKFVRGPARLPGYGMVHVVQDPSGNLFGIFSAT
ncbi:MAG: VOC family protein [Pseudobacteriovorax sp.]|nr:VOC family protein [Pseudobacteriovorax sp.]